MNRPNGPRELRRCDYLKRAQITVFSPTRLIECFLPAALVRISRSRRSSTSALVSAKNLKSIFLRVKSGLVLRVKFGFAPVDIRSAVCCGSHLASF